MTCQAKEAIGRDGPWTLDLFGHHVCCAEQEKATSFSAALQGSFTVTANTTIETDPRLLKLER